MLGKNLKKKSLLESSVSNESCKEEGFTDSTDPNGNTDLENKASGRRRVVQVE